MMKFITNTMRVKLLVTAIILCSSVLCSDNQTESDPYLRNLRRCTECRFYEQKPLLTNPNCVECYCDLDCIKYGDCCIDILIDNNLHTKQIDPGLNCVVPTSTDDIKLRHVDADKFGYYMRNYYFQNGTAKEFCDSRFLPVSCGDGITYINMECALMNKAVDCTHWTIESDCTNDEISNPSCKYYHVPPESVDLRLCDIHRSFDVVSTCKITDSAMMIILCEKYFSLVYGDDGRVYRNMYCYVCNLNGISDIGSGGPNPLSTLTDFSDMFNEAVTPCDGKTAWMDMLAKKCRPVKCYSDKILENGNCLSNNRTALGNKYQLLAELSVSTPLAIPFIKQIIGHLMYTIAETMYTSDYDVALSVQIPQSTRSLLFLHIWLEINHDILIDDIELIFEDMIHERSWLFSTLIARFQVLYYKLQYSEETYKYLQNDHDTGLCCTEEEKLQFSQKSEYEPVSNELSCSYMEFEQFEFIVQEDAFVPHLNLTLSLKDGEFSVFKNKLSVCFELFLLKANLSRTNGTYYIYNKVSNFDVILWYVTIVCISLSLISLVFVIITYLVFREMRSQPGINNLILSCNLFLAQFILMVGFDKTNHVTLCKVLGMTTHFLWLSMLFWMNICSFHMFKVFVFSKFVIPSSNGSAKQSIIYSIYGYGTPILIIITTIVANVIPTSGDQLGYGGNVCYLSSKLLVLYSFVIPLCFVIVSNVMFFIWTVITIHRVKQVGKQSGDRNNVYIYLKLSVVTGVFWTISIISNFIDTVILDYISVILNGSQGVFLLWSFVINKSVWNRWKQKCRKSEPKCRISEPKCRKYEPKCRPSEPKCRKYEPKCRKSEPKGSKSESTVSTISITFRNTTTSDTQVW